MSTRSRERGLCTERSERASSTLRAPRAPGQAPQRKEKRAEGDFPGDGGNRAPPQAWALFSAEIPTEHTGPGSEHPKCVHFSGNWDPELNSFPCLLIQLVLEQRNPFAMWGKVPGLLPGSSPPVWLLQKAGLASPKKTTQPFSHSKTSSISNPLPPKIMASLL